MLSSSSPLDQVDSVDKDHGLFPRPWFETAGTIGQKFAWRSGTGKRLQAPIGWVYPSQNCRLFETLTGPVGRNTTILTNLTIPLAVVQWSSNVYTHHPPVWERTQGCAVDVHLLSTQVMLGIS